MILLLYKLGLSSAFLVLCFESEVLTKCTDCSNLLTPWRGALQGTLAYQCRGWWKSSGTHQSEPHWFATRHFQSWASISSWKASLKQGHDSSLCLSGRAWKTCQNCVLCKTITQISSGKLATSNISKIKVWMVWKVWSSTKDVYFYSYICSNLQSYQRDKITANNYYNS